MLVWETRLPADLCQWVLAHPQSKATLPKHSLHLPPPACKKRKRDYSANHTECIWTRWWHHRKANLCRNPKYCYRYHQPKYDYRLWQSFHSRRTVRKPTGHCPFKKPTWFWTKFIHTTFQPADDRQIIFTLYRSYRCIRFLHLPCSSSQGIKKCRKLISNFRHFPIPL